MRELLEPGQCPEQAMFRDEGANFLMRPIFPESDIFKMAQVLMLCNAARTGDWPDLLVQDRRDADAQYLYERATAEGAWGRIITAQPLGLIPVGFVLGLPYLDTKQNQIPGSQDLRLLMVHPIFWGGGHARHLLSWAADFNRHQGNKQILLWVHADNQRAIRTYEAAGYRETGETKLRQNVPMIQLCLDLTALKEQSD